MYTLAENGTRKLNNERVIVNGKGSDLNKKEALKGRAKRKTITQIMMLKLIEISEKNSEPELAKAFWNSYYCQEKVYTANGRLYGKYCKNRFCTLCCSIRKADIINRYKPVIEKWEDPYFVTLTVKACKANQLGNYFNSLNKNFSKIINKHKKRHQRGKGLKLVGIKSLESNYNPVRKTYNPHLHIIVANKEMADILLNEWCDRAKKGYVNRKGQKADKVWNLDNALVEIIKYGSKIFTEPDLKKRSKETTSPKVYLNALYTILFAMKGKRIFDRFGFNLPMECKPKHYHATLLENFKEWEFNAKTNDWNNTSTGEALTLYNIPSNLQALLENNIDCISK